MRELLSRIWKKEEGFSLIELIIVIAILAIIAAIAVPNLLGNIQKANESTDESNAKLIADSIATAVAQDPTLEGVDILTVNFGKTLVAADTTTAANLTQAQKIMTDAQQIMNGTIPEIKSNEYKGTGNLFIVTLTDDGQVMVTNDAATVTIASGVASAAGGKVIFPTPQ